MSEQDKKQEDVKKHVPDVEQTTTEMDKEIKKMELELKKQELAEMGLRKRERELALRDLEQRVGAADLKAKQLQNDRAAQGQTFSQQDREDANRWKVCTHKKGGIATTRDV